ncbi:MAG: fluoride efflux transporter CrcB [Pseudomonadota bacterium]|nr:fluoride efflux transporter CrcB [Pseudomonadota bacterium]
MQGSFVNQFFLVGLGGFIGSALRFSVSVGLQRWAPQFFLPMGSMAVNILGCFAIGYLGGLLEIKQDLNSGLFLFLMAGILGGFTTFSAYALEVLTLTHNGLIIKAVVLTLSQVIFGISAAWLGFQLAQ